MATLSECISINSNEPLYTPVTLFRSSTSTNDFTSALKDLSVTTCEILSWFRNEGLPISAIADMARVERKSVYAWLDNGPIRKHNQERIEQLYHLFLKSKQTDLLSLYRFWNRQLANGKSLNALLKEEKLNTHAIELALSQLWPLAKKTKKISEKNHSKNQKNPFMEEFREVYIADES